MKQSLTRLKYLCVVLMLFLSYQNSIAMPIQEPYQDRVFDEDFKERYSGKKYNYEGKKIIGETPARTEGYADYTNESKNEKELKERKKRNTNNDISFDLGPFSWLLYILLFGVILYVAYLLLNEGSSGLFSRRQHQKLEEDEEITAENIARTDIDYFIESAESKGDYRLAIRYQYLAVLKILGLKNHIEIEDDKTNSDYLTELYNTPYKDAFKYTSYLYDYIWYGKFPLTEAKYNAAKIHFKQLIKQVH